MVEFRRELLGQMDMMEREMNRLLDYFAGCKPPQVRFSPYVWEPAIDVYETDDSIVVVVELAGVDESDIELTADRETFTVRGYRGKASQAGGKRTYYRMEIAGGPFGRTVNLPVPIDTASMTASYEEGLVEVILPKAKVRTAQKVKIQGSEPTS
jgi:HSP20 family protein